MKKHLNALLIVSILLTSIFIYPDNFYGEVKAVTFDNYVPGELIVKFKPGFTPDALFLAKYNLSSAEKILNINFSEEILPQIKSSGLDKLYLLRLNPLNDLMVAASTLSLDVRVEYAQPNYIFRIQSSEQLAWGLDDSPLHNSLIPGQGPYDADIDAKKLWEDPGLCSDEIGCRTGLPFKVAVIDTGIYADHPDLAGRVLSGWNAITHTTTPTDDDNGHGTHIAGIIGATHNDIGVRGVTNTAQLVPIKACSANRICTSATVTEAITFAISIGDIKVINASFGGHIYQGQLPDLAVFNAILLADVNDILFVTSAGNSGPNLVIGGEVDIDIVQFYPASYPLDNIIVVTNTDTWDRRSGNFGTVSVDLGAPGVTILSTFPCQLPNSNCSTPGYKEMGGSSMATAYVSGAIALYWSYNLGFGYLEIKDKLLERVESIASLSGTTVSGGRLNVFNLFQGDPADLLPQL